MKISANHYGRTHYSLCSSLSFQWEVPLPQPMTNRTTVHPRAQFTLGVDCDFFSHQSFQQLKKQAGPAAVSPPSLLGFQISHRLEVGDGPLDGGSGECKIFGNGRKRGPAFSLPIRPVVQIDVNGFYPVGQRVVPIDLFQSTQ
mgnify:CR=1 FL=1